MEIKRSSSSVLNVVQENSTTETEKKSEKSLARGVASAKDSFEVSSSSNQENSGKKELGAAQQQEASKVNYKDFGNNGTASQDSRTRYEDAKNSGLAARLGHSKQESDPRTDRLPKGMTADDIKNLNSPISSEQTSDAVKDAQQKLNGGTNMRDSLDQELAQRRSDYSMFGGSSPMDRLRNSTPDPTAAPKGKGSVPTGADQVAYQDISSHKNTDGTTTYVDDNTFTSKDGTVHVEHHEFTTGFWDGSKFYENKDTLFYANNTKVEKYSKENYDDQGKLTSSTSTTTTTQSNGTVTVNTSTTTKNENGSTTTNTTETTTPPGGSRKMPGIDDQGTGNIPDDIRQSIEYSLQQIRNSKPKTGGETELTDGGVTGNSADGSGPINNAFTRTGGVMGAVAQPTRAGEYVGGPSNGTVGSAIQNGGATDSLDGSSWTGTTHQDDPGDVQFGPADQPKEQGNKKTDETEDSSKSVFDLFRNQKSKQKLQLSRTQLEAKMEIKKSSSSVLNVVQENSTTETEKKSEKSLARGVASAKDSFEVSSSSNQESSGTKQLGAAEQQEASKMNYKDFGSNGTTSQDSRTRFEDAKNSGLVARLGHSKQESDPRTDRLPKGMTADDIKNLNSPISSEQTSDAVKDAQQKLNGGTNMRDSLDQELAQRRSDYSMFGGSSPIDRLRNSTPDPTAAPKGKGTAPTGADAVAYNKSKWHQNEDGSLTQIKDSVDSVDGDVYMRRTEKTYNNDGTRLEETKQTVFKGDNSKVETDSKNLFDANGKLTEHTSITKSTDKDGTVTVTTETITPGSGSKKMPGVDDRESGNIPDDIKQSIEYSLQQIRNSKPKSGGETELTDGGVTGNSADGSVPVNDAFTRTGGVMGAVAQPTRAGEEVGNPSNVTVGSAIQNGGATDSLDGSSWTGTTHQDDPADVKFGPQTPVAGSVDSKTKDQDADNDSSLLNQILNRKSKKSE